MDYYLRSWMVVVVIELQQFTIIILVAREGK